MELITSLLDLILHIDKHLQAFVTQYGTWVYVLIFAIVFTETGVVVMPFLPGIRCCLSLARCAGWG